VVSASHEPGADAPLAGPTQPTLRRMQAFGIRPKRDLGQNFLIDSNILDVIARAAELAPDDVVLEIGGGLGVLSEHLAARVAHVHVVEIDRGLEPALRDALDPFGGRATLWLADAMALDLRALSPAPTKVVANLPYGIAAGAILRTIEELSSVMRWVAMVQKEVGERFAAQAGTGAYGVPSVLAQLACEVRVLRPISRQVFFPVPNVDSVLVGLERREAAPTGASHVRAGEVPPPVVPPGLRAFVQGAFAHRRKALARSVALAGMADRDAVRAALEALGEPADVRAERLAPERLRELWEAVARAPAGPPAPDPPASEPGPRP
jgi:16S rRNA (adenine1518-N6/adenine1519-N6)-dimethyltransferase